MSERSPLLSRLRNALRGVRLPSIEWPTLGRVTDIPVYVIHNSGEADDYFFIFDFEQFVERSREGAFVRPRLKVWAGRDDFDRRLFARQFRQSFAREFDAARAALEAEDDGKRGWFGWLRSLDLGAFELSPTILAANVLLLLATTTGRVVSAMLPLPRWGRSGNEAEALERSIEETQAKVDAALAGLVVTLHIDLYRHAWRGCRGGRLTGMDYDAWPLPGYVSEHLDDGRSGSWW